MPADAGSSRTGTWIELAVTPAVTAGATVTFVVAGESADGVDSASREYGTVAKRRQPVIVSSGASVKSAAWSRFEGAPIDTEPAKAKATKTPMAEASTVTLAPRAKPTAEPTSTLTPMDTATPSDVPTPTETLQPMPVAEQSNPAAADPGVDA